ncbi:BspA family leucine-rich repeat surface protein, partial [Listeria monocytogenes]|uniref:BspA family leucine-rich repeat surface protein n=1 Tax=Listeria monocytogenes TaxID=1639 RepID=UPI003D32D905
VTNMAAMFSDNEKLEKLDLSTFDTSSVTNMGTFCSVKILISGYFYNLKDLDRFVYWNHFPHLLDCRSHF